MRTEQIVAKALENFGADRYKLALSVAKRTRALSAGAQTLLDIDTRKMKFADIALLEIAEGKVEIEAIVETEK